MEDEFALPAAKAPIDALPIDLDYIPAQLKIRAESELFENENSKIQSLKLLRSMLKGDKDLRYQNDDLFLVTFLRAKKFDVERAFKSIKGFYTALGKHGHYFYNFSFDHLKKTMELNCMYVLPYRDSEGCAIFLFRFTTWDPWVTSMDDIMYCGLLAFMQALRYPSTQIAGFKLVIDCKDFQLMHLLRFKFSSLLLFAEMTKNAGPFRLRGIHMVHEYPIIRVTLNRLLPNKLRERVHAHGRDLKSLHQFIMPNILPADLGGEQQEFNNADWRERMEASTDYMRHMLSFGYEKYLRKDTRDRNPL